MKPHRYLQKGYGGWNHFVGKRVNPRNQLIAVVAVLGLIFGIGVYAASQTK